MENQKVRLSQRVIDTAESADAEYMIHDTAIAGFALRVRPTGAKSFVFRYRTAGGRRGKVRRVTIPGHRAEVARAKAKKLAAQHHGGADPAGAMAERRNRLTVAEVLDRFLADHVDAELKPKTAMEYRRIVDKILKPRLGGIAIDALATKDVAAAYQAWRVKPTQAALAVRVLSSAMSLAQEWGLRPDGLANPAKIRLKGARRRQRLFSDAEVARLRRAIDALEKDGNVAPSVALALRLLFATGCRAGEISDLVWPNVDFDEGVLRWADSKTGYIEKPMTTEARRLLESTDRIVGVDWVCPSPSCSRLRIETLEAGFERAMQAAGVAAGDNATLHLIRHWFATKIYTDKSIDLPTQMALLGHRSVATAMRYAHVTRDHVGKAAEDAAKRRDRAIRAAGKRGTVVALPGGGD